MDQHDSLPRRIPMGIAVAGLAATAFPVVAESGVDFAVTRGDQREPGRAGTFELELAAGYSASGTLEGRIQLHG